MLKRYDDEGRNEADLPLVHWGVQDALYQAEQAMDDLLQNFPNRVVAGLLNVGDLPDRTSLSGTFLTSWDHKVAKILQVPNATRSRIGRGQYLTPSEHNPVGLLEEALVDVIAADPFISGSVKSWVKPAVYPSDELAHNALAKGLIDKDEAAILVKA